MRTIKLNVPIELRFFRDEDENAAKVMAALVERTLSLPEYQDKMNAVIDSAVEETKKDFPLLQTKEE